MKRMKTLLNIGVLLVSMSALASPSDPTIFQYWLDADQQSRSANTRAYNASSNPLTIDVGNLSEGGHALYYRMATEDEGKVMWGKPVSKYFYVPSSPDKSNSVPTAYRLIVNNDVVEQGQVPAGSSFTLNPAFPENRVLASVSDRDFKYNKGEKNISMTANGTFTYAVQLMSDQKEWGAPFIKEISDQVTTKLPYDSIQVPERYTFSKVDNNNFKAYRFRNNYSDYLYITPSQDCKVSLYYVSEGYTGNLGGIDSYELKKGVTTRVNSGSPGSDVMAVFYATPTDKDNSAAEVSLDIMLEDNQVPKPVVRLDPDTWEMTITCPDQRATIFYTLDGSKASTSGTVYTGPVILDKFTRVRAIAVVGGYDDSEEEDMQYGSAHLRIPVPELKYAGGIDKNEFILTNRVEGVTMYYTFGDNDVEDEVLRIPFDGTPFKIENGAYLKAYAVKDNLADSEILGRYVYLSEYVAQAPSLYDRRTEGEDHEWYSDRKEMINFNVPEGTAYYRIVPGKQTFDASEEIVKEQWTQYNREVNDGWIELPGGANSGNQTVQVYAESDDKAPSAVTDIYTNWVRAKAPKIDYNNYKLKLSTDVPGGVIKYNLGYYSPDDAKVYTEEEFPEGIDVKEQWLVTAFVVAEGYENSSAPEINRDRYNLDRPAIEYQEDGYLHVYQNDEGVSLRLEITPPQSYETVSENHIRFIPQYNTTVKAQAVKYGRNDSEVSERNPFYQPNINVDAYRVWIDYEWYANVYYTTDGSMPTRESNHYEGEFYVDNACTVRAVAFCDNEIPSEAEPKRVLDQTEKPELIFNFTVQDTEEGPKQSRKVKFSCSTPGARIYYSVGTGLNDDTRKLYDPSVDWDGIDVGTGNYVYAYAEADDYRRSEEIYREMSEGLLSQPGISCDGDMVEIWHDDPTVTIVPVFTPQQEYSYVHDAETNRITCKVAPDSQVKAHVEKAGYITSGDVSMAPCDKPQIFVDEYRVWIDPYWSEIYYTIDGSEPTKASTRYDGEFYVDKACTVKAVRYENGSIPSLAEAGKVMDRTETPHLTFNFDRSKEQKKVYLSSSTPGAKIYYTLDRSLNNSNRVLYDPSKDVEGIDVKGKNYLYAYAEADDYRRSEELDVNLDEGLLSQPNISVIGADGKIEITHDDPTVTIVPTIYIDTPDRPFAPEDYVYTHDAETNKITFTATFNTVVKAHSVKSGYYDSDDAERSANDRPYINVDGYRVWIDNPYGDVYYSTDGSVPTKDDDHYYSEGFETVAGTVRAVRFADGEIPAEAEPAKVMDQAATPEVIFNFSIAEVTEEDEDGNEVKKSVELRRIKFASSTPEAKISYKLNNKPTWETYDAANAPDGIDVTGTSYLYTYAEADGYRRSEEIYRDMSDGVLYQPEIRCVGDVVEIWHDDPSVTIVPVFSPAHEFTYVHDAENNKVTCKVKPNTTVSATVQKTGCLSSSAARITPSAKPTIYLDGDRVTIDSPWEEIYYTTDGTLPSMDSERYVDSFEAMGATVRAVKYEAGYTPSEADPMLMAPVIKVTDGVVEISHKDPSTKIVPVFTPEQEYVKDDKSNKITCKVAYNTVVSAHVEKTGCKPSSKAEKYHVAKPQIYVDGYYVYMSNNQGEGDIFYTLDGSMPTKESKLYEDGFDTKACTVRAVCIVDGEIAAEADAAKVMDQAATPQIEFNFSRSVVDGENVDSKKVKFTCATPGAKIYYSLGRSINESNRKLYNPSVDVDGVDVADINTVYAYATADGYRDSESTSRNMSDGLLGGPEIRVDDCKVVITHDDPTVTIVPVFSPEQEYTYVHDAKTNTVTCEVQYNTVVKAHVEKSGYISSDVVQVNPLDKVTIRVNGYTVEIDTNDWNVYYTTDGSMPTKSSMLYDGAFDSPAGTVRAVAFFDGYIPSEATPATVMDQAAMPEIDLENGFAKLSSSTPGAVIYYTLDQGISITTRQLYDPAALPNGIDLSNVGVIRSYALAEGYRQSETLMFNKDAYTLLPPTLSYAGGYVSAEHDEADVTIKFTDLSGNVLQAEAGNARRVKVPYNTTVIATAQRKGYLDSRTAQIKHTDAPTITADLFKITIKGKSGQTLRYTTDGSLPGATSKEYEGPFYVTESCKVRAAAFVDEQVPSEAESIDIAYRKSLKPEVKSYDGRYLTLSAENGSTIKYVIGNDADVNNGTVADDRIDLKGLSVLKAIAQRSDADDSEEFTYIPEYYADETDVYVSKPGVVEKAFEWCDDLSEYRSLKVHGTLMDESQEDDADYGFLRSMSGLRHLDLSDVTDSALPDGAFDTMKLVSVVLPSSMKTVGDNIFGKDNTTLCAVELPGDGFAPQNLLDGVANPNVLIYVKNRNLVNDLAAASPVAKNIVVLGSVNSSNRADNVTLSHANAFYAPKEFIAQKISFTRSFTKETQIGGFGSGWETMVVPFDVQSINCGVKTLKPFGDADTDRGECPFWLFSAAETSWMAETSMLANTPYLLAMPNNPLYADEFVVKGDVVFSSNNVSVPVTPTEDEMTFSFSAGRYLTGNYERIDKEESVLAINDEVVFYHDTNFQPGGIFVSGQKDVVPFECYVVSEGAKALPVFDQSEIDEIIGEFGTRVWSESYDIYIHSAIGMNVRIYDSTGQLIRSVNVRAGETVRVQDITPGIYFVGTTKILVKKG